MVLEYRSNYSHELSENEKESLPYKDKRLQRQEQIDFDHRIYMNESSRNGT